MSVVRLGIVGCGWIANAHLRAMRELADRCTLAWAADPDRERAECIAERVGARALTDFRDGLADVDAVIVATPHHLHAEQAIAVAEAGKHLLLEKPMATTLADADRILAAAEKAGVVLLVGYTRHYQPQFRQLRALVEGGTLGRVLMLRAEMLEDVGGYLSGWMARKDRLGGGVYFSAGGHPVEWLVSLGGSVVETHALTARFKVEMEGEDSVVVAYRFQSGALGTLTHTWCQPHATTWMGIRAGCEGGLVDLALSAMQGGPGDWDWRARLTLQQDRAERVLYEGAAGFEFTPQLAHFLDCVAGTATPETGGQYARQIMAVTLGQPLP